MYVAQLVTTENFWQTDLWMCGFDPQDVYLSCVLDVLLVSVAMMFVGNTTVAWSDKTFICPSRTAAGEFEHRPPTYKIDRTIKREVK